MKNILLFIVFTFSSQLYAQEKETTKPVIKVFVRLYDNGNHKVGKGHLLYGNDSTIQLSKGHTTKSFPVTEIQFIKTSHAAGHNLLIGTSIGISAGIAAVSVAAIVGNGNDNGTSSFDIAAAGLICPVAGVVAGGVAEALRNSKTFLINRNNAQWIVVRKELLNLN